MGKKKNPKKYATAAATMKAAAAEAKVQQKLFYSDQSLGLPGNAQNPDEEMITLRAAIDTWDNSSFATITIIRRHLQGVKWGWEIEGVR